MADYGLRPDGSKKGTGYLGAVRNKFGDVMTEFTVGIELDGEEVDIPTLVPTLTKSEVKQLQDLDDDTPIPDSIINKAVKHAIMRKQEGKSVFIGDGEDATTKLIRQRLGL